MLDEVIWPQRSAKHVMFIADGKRGPRRQDRAGRPEPPGTGRRRTAPCHLPRTDARGASVPVGTDIVLFVLPKAGIRSGRGPVRLTAPAGCPAAGASAPGRQPCSLRPAPFPIGTAAHPLPAVRGRPRTSKPAAGCAAVRPTGPSTTRAPIRRSSSRSSTPTTGCCWARHAWPARPVLHAGRLRRAGGVAGDGRGRGRSARRSASRSDARATSAPSRGRSRLAHARLHRDGKDTTRSGCDGVEIIEARWFSREELATAVAADRDPARHGFRSPGRLIEHWYGGALPQAGR